MNIEFTEEELVILNKALVALPYVEVAQLISNINRQIVADLADKKNEN